MVGFLIRIHNYSFEDAVQVVKAMRIKHGRSVLTSGKSARFMQQIMRVRDLDYKITGYRVPSDRLGDDSEGAM